MTKLAWDQIGERRYETGVDRGALYIPNGAGIYDNGVAWNGLTKVSEAPSGAESKKQYADNSVYLNLLSAEEFGGTIEAFTYPDEFGQCDGTMEPVPGLRVGQQTRKSFGFSWRTLIGNDLLGTDFGYTLHLAYQALAQPSSKDNTTVNDSPEAVALSWTFSTTPVEVGAGYKKSAHLALDSTKVDATALAALEDILYGTEGQAPRLPTPAEVIALFSGTVTVATPTKPVYNPTTDAVTIPAITGVIYSIGGVDQVAGDIIITADTFITARPAAGYTFAANVDNDWLISFA